MLRFALDGIPLLLSAPWLGLGGSGAEVRTPVHLELFECPQLRCTLTKGACLARQLAKTERGGIAHKMCGRPVDEKTGAPGASPCAKGNAVLVELGVWRPSDAPRKRTSFRQMASIRRKLAIERQRTSGGEG